MMSIPGISLRNVAPSCEVSQNLGLRSADNFPKKAETMVEIQVLGSRPVETVQNISDMCESTLI